MNYAVIGFPKCGTTSMRDYLRVKYPDDNIVKLEFPIYGEAYKFSDFKILKGYKPIIMIRDKVDFLWSFYNYFSLSTVPFEDFLDMPFRAYNMKGLTPLQQCDFDKWIEPFKKFNPMVTRLEDMMDKDDFPWNPITMTKDKPPMSDRDRGIALDRLTSLNLYP